MNLDGKTVVVTGASAGIGRAIAITAARAGARVVMGARRLGVLEDLAHAIYEEILGGIRSAGTKTHPGISAFKLDVQSQRSVEEFAANVLTLGPVDILVSNAGLSRERDPLVQNKPEFFDEQVDTNLKGALRITHAILPSMLKRNSGHVLFTGSVSGRDPYAGGTVYCATKAAISMVARCLRDELAGTKVKITNIMPGWTKTEFSEVRFPHDPERAKRVYDGIRALDPEDVAECALFAMTRPEHVSVDEILVLPQDQITAPKLVRYGKADESFVLPT